MTDLRFNLIIWRKNMCKMNLMIIVKPCSKSKAMPLSQLTELNEVPQKVKKGGLMALKSRHHPLYQHGDMDKIIVKPLGLGLGTVFGD